MSIRIFAKKKSKDQTVLKKKNSAAPIAEPLSMNLIPNVNIAVQDYKNLPVGAAFPWSKACEARPVDETASKVWRRGQNIQGVCRRIFWEPQELGDRCGTHGGGIHPISSDII